MIWLRGLLLRVHFGRLSCRGELRKYEEDDESTKFDGDMDQVYRQRTLVESDEAEVQGAFPFERT